MDPLAGILCLFVACVVFNLRGRQKRNLPPGPRRLPVVGNATDIPKDDAWLLFSTWAEKYGPIVYFKLFGQSAIVVNTHDAAIDLMTRRARLYSERPWNYVAGQLLNGGHGLPFMNFTDKWRRIRRVAHEGLRKSGLGRYRKLQHMEALRVAIAFLKSPDLWEQHLMTNAVSVIMSSVYGFPSTDETNPTVRTIRRYTERLARAVYPGAYLVESLPWLRHLPAWAASWKREALRFYSEDAVFLRGLFHQSRRSTPADTTMPSFAESVFDHVDDGSIEEIDAAWLCGTLFSAGAETTSASLCWFLLCMVRHREVQEKAQAEIDRVVGRLRIPTFDDMSRLVYLAAIIKEVLRWRPPLPLGLPHRIATGDVYRDFDIPAGTLCIPNIWKINHDPIVWGADADRFRPERHLSGDGSLTNYVLSGHDECHTSFGFGQRICVGRHFAADTLFITCATILWACNVSPAVDKDGVPSLPSETDHTNTGMTLHPDHFDCRIEMRAPDVLERLEAVQQSLSST